jgi:hypothetical protein
MIPLSKTGERVHTSKFLIKIKIKKFFMLEKWLFRFSLVPAVWLDPSSVYAIPPELRYIANIREISPSH